MNNKKQSSEKAFFFLRHNNDIDHIVPVLNKWLSTENVETDVIIPTDRNLLNDYRINYLKTHKNVNIYYLDDLFKKLKMEHFFNFIYFKYDTQSDNLINKNKIVKKLADKSINRIVKQIFKGAESGIVVFDWTMTYFTKKIVEHAKCKNFITVSLPHGDRVYVSLMERTDDINYKHMEKNKSIDIFDYVVVPNRFCAERYDKLIDNKKIKILGSSRYSDEWLDIISKSIEPYFLEECKDKLKIVMFLRNTGFPICWKEVVIAIKLITQFPEVYLIVKNHPRSTNKKILETELLNSYPEIKNNYDVNLKFLYADVNSVSLLKWADIIIDLGTSIVWEAVKRGKPVLIPEYLNANYTFIADYMKESNIKSRDELYDTIESFVKNKNQKFYNEADRQRFIKDIIDFPDKNSLERYCNFLKMCLYESIEKQSKR